MKNIYILFIITTIWSCITTDNKKPIDNIKDTKVVEIENIEPKTEKILFTSEIISDYNNLRLLMNKNYYWVYNVFNEKEFETSRNDTFKDLALITKNNFEDFVTKNNFKNSDEFKNFFIQFKPIGTYKNKFEKKHQIELTKIEKIIERITR